MIEDLSKLLLIHEQDADELVKRATARLKDAPQGVLRVFKHYTNYQYYQMLPHKRNYISKKKPELAIKLAQKKYDTEVLKAALKLRDSIALLRQIVDETDYCDIINQFPAEERKLIKPYFFTDEEFVEQWKAMPFEPKVIDALSPSLVSNNGERVRSKSEKIIADKLAALGIPYRYECPLYLNGIGTVYPDFTMLKLITREDIYWEHFGMMDDKTYSDKAMSKINYYVRNGYIPGKNLLLTFESRTCPLNMKVVETQLYSILDLQI